MSTQEATNKIGAMMFKYGIERAEPRTAWGFWQAICALNQQVIKERRI